MPDLVVLGSSADAHSGLWSLNSDGKWSSLGNIEGATGLGRTTDGIAVASNHSVDFRPASSLAHVGSITTLKWSGKTPSQPVVSLSRSQLGKLAIATSDEYSLGYGLAAGDGTVTPIAGAPTQTFTPLVAWLDESRLLVLSTDNQQVSRLAKLDVTAHHLTTSSAIQGVTTFGASSDGQQVAVSTERTVYAESVAAMFSGTEPQTVATVPELEVVWALSMNATGSRVFILAAMVAANGKLSEFHELTYERQGSKWTMLRDSPAPFAAAVAQVCLT